MKLLVEFELDESWDAYIPDNEEKLKNLIKPQLEGVTTRIVENLDLQIVSKSFYCQSEIEGNKMCKEQCDHCKEYYKPLERQ